MLLGAVILGLALTDLALSLQRLLDARERVRWDYLAPLAALVAFLKIVTQWWTWFQGESLAAAITFEMFVGILLSAGTLFLLAATALPDEVHGDRVDLASHYATVSRRFWILFTLHYLLANAIVIWIEMGLGGAHFSMTWPAMLLLPCSVLLAFFRARWLHAIALCGFVLLYLFQNFGKSLVN